MKQAAIMACVLLAGCAYDPPAKGDHTALKYRNDLKKCQIQSANAVNVVRNATVGSTLRNIFDSNEPIREDIRKCMQSKGYVLE